MTFKFLFNTIKIKKTLRDYTLLNYQNMYKCTGNVNNLSGRKSDPNLLSNLFGRTSHCNDMIYGYEKHFIIIDMNDIARNYIFLIYVSVLEK